MARLVQPTVKRTTLFAIALLVGASAGCSQATFPPSSDAALTIKLNADGTGSLDVTVPPGVEAVPLASEILSMVYPSSTADPAGPAATVSARAWLDPAFEAGSPSLAFDAEPVVSLLRSAGATTVLLSICTPSGVRVSVDATSAPHQSSGCSRWSLGAGEPGFRLALTLHPSAGRFWALGTLSLVIILCAASALIASLAGKRRWNRRRRGLAAALSILAAGPLAVWIRLSSSAADGNVRMSGLTGWAVTGVRIAAALALALGLASVLTAAVALSRTTTDRAPVPEGS